MKGNTVLHDKHRCGPPKKLRGSALATANRLKQEGMFVSEIKKVLRGKHSVDVDEKTIRRATRKTRKGPKPPDEFELPPRVRKQRLDYRKDHKNDSMDQWYNTWWMDSTTLKWPADSCTPQHKIQPIRMGRRLAKQCVRHVYSAVSAIGGRLPLIDVPLKTKSQIADTWGRGRAALQQHKPFCSEDFQLILPRMHAMAMQRMPGADVRWVIDGASQHTTPEVEAIMTTRGITLVQPWPSHSPDLNIIENCWSVLKSKLRRMPAVTKEQWDRNIKAAWREAVTPEFIQQCVNSMPKRLTAVKSRKGDEIKHYRDY